MPIFYYPDPPENLFDQCLNKLHRFNFEPLILEKGKLFNVLKQKRIKLERLDPTGGLTRPGKAIIVNHAERLKEKALLTLKKFNLPTFLFGKSSDLLLENSTEVRPRTMPEKNKTGFEKNGFVTGIPIFTPEQAEKILAIFKKEEKKLLDAQNGVWSLRQVNFTDDKHKSLGSWVKSMATYPLILKHIEEIIGSDILIRNADIFILEPNDSRTVSWHLDTHHSWENTKGIVTAWINLTPVDINSGTLCFIPGSHKHHFINEPADKDSYTLSGENLIGLDFLCPAANEMEPGHMSIHAARTAHSSVTNHGDERRIAFVIRFISGDTEPKHADCGKIYQARGQSKWPYLKRKTIPLHWHLPDPFNS